MSRRDPQLATYLILAFVAALITLCCGLAATAQPTIPQAPGTPADGR